MKGPKLTAYLILLSGFILALSSCEKNAEKKKTMEFEKKDIPLTGAQETPPNASTALGSMDVAYSKETRTLSWTVRWSGLTDSVTLMHIHGLAPSGFAAGTVQNIIGGTTAAQSPFIFAAKTGTKSNFGKTGTVSGTMLADGVVVKENDLLSGNYYMNIHTSAFPTGEIRGQIVFQ